MDSDYQYSRMEVHYTNFLVPPGYSLSKIGSKYKDSSHFFINGGGKFGSTLISDWMKISCDKDDDSIIDNTWFPCITKNKEIVDNGEPFAVSFSINKR